MRLRTLVIVIALLSSSYAYAANPVIQSISPTSGPVGTQVQLNGSGFGAVQGGSTILLGTSTATANSWNDTSIVVAVPSGASSAPFAVTVNGQVADSALFTVTPLPAGWTDSDIGSVGLAGTATYASGVFTINGSGSGIGGTADGMHFVYQPLSGDGTIVARVESDSGGQAGVMIRETLNVNATYGFTFNQSPYIYFYDRASTGGSTGSPGYLYHGLPYWIKVVRSGSTLTGYTSPDGVNWASLGSVQITMAQNVYIGLVVSSQSNSGLATATFDNVSISSAAAPAPVITGLSATTGPVGSQVIISGSGFGSTQGGSLVSLSGSPVTISFWSDSSINITIPTGATSGPVVVSVAPGMNDSNPIVFTVTSQPLPTPWLDADVGAVGVFGTATYASGVFTINGSGSGIGGTADGMHFVYQPLSGDGTIVARVVSDSGGQAGVMIRETLNGSATDAYTIYQYSNAYFYDRVSTGASVTYVNGVAALLPCWVKLVRTGNTLSSYSSADGVNWKQIGSSQTITIARSAYVGLVVSSQSNSGPATATFDNVSISSAAAPAPVITGLSATTGPVGSQVIISGSGFGSSPGSSIVMLNGVLAPVNSWNATSILITVPSGATSGPVIVSVAPSMNDSNPVVFTVTSNPLPPGWLDRDLGAVGGGATYSSGTFTINGAGGSIGGTADAFHFVYQPLSGDGTIVARVANIQGGTYPVLAVMFRETLNPGSIDAFVDYYPNQGGFYYRSSTGASTSSQQTGFVGPNHPYWLKLTRSGNTFTGYVSLDGVYWTQVGPSQTITMAVNVYIGLAVSPKGTTATFDNVSLSSTTVPGPVITAVSATTGSIGSQIIITGSGFGASQGNSAVFLSDAPMIVNSWSDTSITMTIASGAISGYLVVSVAPNMNDSNPILFTVTTQPLPSGWLDQDIGAQGGSATYSSGTFTINGAGGSISGTADAFHFVYQPLSGDGTIVARVANIQGGSYPVAGVMIRETLNPGSTVAFVDYYPNQGGFYYRSSTGASTSSQAIGLVGPYYPYWLRLTRSGNTFTGYVSLDGVYWTQAGSSQTITMAQNVYIGLAVPQKGATATFDNVSVLTGTVYPIPVVTSVSPAVAGLGYSITISGSSFGPTQGTSTVYFNGVPASAVTNWSDRQIIAAVPNGATTGPVTVITNGIGSNRTVSISLYNPVIGSITPPFGATGGKVVISGSGFTSPTGYAQVAFNGTSESVSPTSDSSITAPIPSGATTGPVTVSVNGVPSNAVQFSVDGTPTIDSAYPTAGAVASSVTIMGSGFGASQSNSTVQFNGAAAPVTSWSDTEIAATVPGMASTGPITVTVAGLVAQGPTFVLNNTVQLTDSLGDVTTYASTMSAGEWNVSGVTGSGCSTCSIRGNTQFTYDGIGNVLSKTDALGHTIAYAYDGNNNLTSESAQLDANTTVKSSYTYNSFGEVLTATDPLGNVRTNTYDSQGNLLSVTTPAPSSGAAASVTQFAYDPKGELTQITDPLNHVTKIAYNSVGLISSITDAQQNVTTYEYDAHGNRTAIVDAMQHRTTFAYDAGDRLITITYPDSTQMSFGYDSRGRRTSITDQNSKITTYAYDDADRLISVTDAANNLTQYAYDTEDNLTSITDAMGRVTSFNYDAFGRVTQTNLPSSLAETYTYDAIGNLTSKTDRKQQTIGYVYDALNRLTHKGYPDSTGLDYVYDLVGKVKQVTDQTGTYGFAYDNMGRLIGTTTQYSFLPGHTFTNSYGYDADSNRTSTTTPDGGTNAYGYDTLNRLTDLTNSWAGHFGFGYDVLNRRTSLNRPNGVNTSYSYDSLSRLLSVLHQAGGTTIDGASYILDNAGNRTSKQNLMNGVSEGYSYDAIYQLMGTQQGGSTSESYTYDKVGNRLSSITSAVNQYNSSNELTSDASFTYGYDNNGNMTSKTDANAATTGYTWDFENRMTSVVLPGTGGTVSFRYDPFGRRIQKSSASSTTIYAYDGASIADEYDGAGNLAGQYTQGAGVDEPLAMSRSGTIAYYLADGLGSVTSLTDSTGSALAAYTRDSFGKSLSSAGTLVNSFRYTAREWDSETSLYYYRARYYSPELGRFLNEDPIRSGMNFYAYALNSTPNFVDPTGTDAAFVQNGDTVTVTATIVLHRSPDDPNPSLWYAFYWQWAVNQWWNNAGNNFTIGRCRLKFNVQVIPAWDHKTPRIGPVNDVYIRNSANYTRSRVVDHKTGYWWNGADPWTIAHETGHLFYLPDHYDRITGIPNPGWEQDIMGVDQGAITSKSLRELTHKGGCGCE